MRDIVKRVFAERDIKLNEELWDATYRVYNEAVEDGMNLDITTGYGDNRYVTMQKMKGNVATFAAFKNHDNIARLVEALEDENGKLRTFSQFKKEAKKINRIYNENWLQAEYDTATRSSKMARRWTDFQRDKKVFPSLRYVTQQDDRVRPAHAVLNNVVRHIDDEFWNIYFPPNGWRCRCDVIQTDDPVTEDFTVPEVEEVPPAFRGNSGKNGIIFHKEHPYFNDTSVDERQKVIQAMHEFSARNKSSYTAIKSGVDGTHHVAAHYDVGTDDIKHHLDIATTFLNNDNDVRLLPHYSETAGIRWPDMLLNEEVLLEVKTLTTNNPDRLLNRAIKAGQQLKNTVYNATDGYVVIETEQFKDEELIRFLHRYFGTSSRDKIYIYRDNRLYEFNRGDNFTF